jgi:hypothetical protein
MKLAASVTERDVEQKRVLFYGARNDPDGKRLLAAVAGAIPEGSLEIYRDLGELSRGLRTPGRTGSVVIILASSQEELKDSHLLKDLLSDVPTILVVPDQDEATIQWAHQMIPRFISQKDSDFASLASVLERMLTTES